MFLYFFYLRHEEGNTQILEEKSLNQNFFAVHLIISLSSSECDGKVPLILSIEPENRYL